MKKSGAQLQLEIEDYLAEQSGEDRSAVRDHEQRGEHPADREADRGATRQGEHARRLQREGKKLLKRYLGPVRNAGEIAKRDAVDWANGAGGNNPFSGADEAGKERWARRWLALYDVAFSHGGSWKPSSEGNR